MTVQIEDRFTRAASIPSLEEAMEERGETLEDVIDAVVGGRCYDFTVWTANTVYFPLVYEMDLWTGSVSRNPDGKPTQAQGG